MNEEERLIMWLLEGDPSIVYQTHKAFLETPIDELMTLQKRMESEGWVSDFLEYRDDVSGLWAGDYYSPKWISTTYTLWELKACSISPRNKTYHESSNLLLNYLWENQYPKNVGIIDLCVCGMILNICCYAKLESPYVNEIIDYILDKQMQDGAWNCRIEEKPHHSSLHTTINILEGLQTYLGNGYNYKKDALLKMREEAHEFILCHELFKSDKTGAIIDKKMTMLSYPSRWRYDILRALVYFESIKWPFDIRMEAGIEKILKKQRKDGTWPVQQKYSGLTYFDMEKTGGASRWNTLRVMKVLFFYKPQIAEDIMNNF